MKDDWQPYNTRATHKLFGAIIITHRSPQGHVMGTLTTTNQRFVAMMENITFPIISTGGTGAPRTARPITRAKRVSLLSNEILALLR